MRLFFPKKSANIFPKLKTKSGTRIQFGLDGNPIVVYSKQKRGIRLMFWSGKSFAEEKLNVEGEKFQDASIFYNDVNEIDRDELKRWPAKSEEIQRDYKIL